MPGLGTRRSRLYEQSIVQLPCGGKIIKKKNFEKRGVHPDGQKAYKEKLE